MRSTKNLSLALTASLLSAMLVSLGCGSNGTDPAVSKAKKEIAEAAKATAEAARVKRDEFTSFMTKRLDELNTQYEKLAATVAKAGDKAGKDLEKKLEMAKAKRDAAAEKLEELKNSAADRWEKIKDGLGNALDDLKKAFD